MRLPRLFATVLAVLALGCSLVSAAELRLGTPFTDHMVLQRHKPVPVWGWADAGDTVTVSFAGQSKSAQAGADGKWVVRLDALTASAESRALSVADAHGRKVELTDVLVGEVWLGSGQSNMEMTVQSSQNFDQEKAAAKFPLIRHFREESAATEDKRATGKGKWTVCSPDTVGGYSAVLYFFGRELHRELNIPIGLINSSVGGTPVESWIDAEAQARTPAVAARLSTLQKSYASFDAEKAKIAYDKQVEQWKAAVAKAKADGKPEPRKPYSPFDTRRRNGAPGGLFNAKINPLIPYALGGFLWYQGESNANYEGGPMYKDHLTLLVQDWRAQWNDDLPFAWVQLANFNSGEGWLLVWESMVKCLSIPKTGMAIINDVGHPTDIHPKNKQEVGRRLSLWALGTVYGKKVPSISGPIPSGHEVRGSSVVVSFSHADQGLKARDGGPLKGFLIAGADQQWKPATAKVEGSDKVVVSSPEVSAPVAVRYAWATYPDCNLVNGVDLPATSFRTDAWPVPAVAPKK
jgi:sialate O-acetylesterase